MTRKYVGLIRKESGTDYWADVPDVPGCISSGVTEEEARANFQEALKLHLVSLKEQGRALRAPRDRADVLAAEEDAYLSDFIIEI